MSKSPSPPSSSSSSSCFLGLDGLEDYFICFAGDLAGEAFPDAFLGVEDFGSCFTIALVLEDAAGAPPFPTFYFTAFLTSMDSSE
jgi:hypothetical protein